MAYEYHASVESDEEIEEIVHDVWGLTLQSDGDEGSESASEDEDRESLPDSPPPDDTKSKELLYVCSKREQNRPLRETIR